MRGGRQPAQSPRPSTVRLQAMRTYPDANHAVYDVTRRVLAEGHASSPRGMETRELLFEAFEIERPWFSVPTGIDRPGLNPAMAALEALQNVAGEQRPELFQRIAPQSSKFARLVYGARLAPQLPAIVDMLSEDTDSRQAVATIWRDELLTSPGAEDHCTVSLQFVRRFDYLHMAVNMRSNDVFWGLTYDIPQFAQLQCSVANALGIVPGRYFHFAGSMHMYARHWSRFAEMTEPTADTNPGPLLHGIGDKGDSWPLISARARAILDGNGDRLIGGPTGSERWFIEQLAPYQTKED